MAIVFTALSIYAVKTLPIYQAKDAAHTFSCMTAVDEKAAT